MQTRALKTLVTISNVGAFAAAANLLSMTPSAVSMQMKSLEDELGVDLFDRSFRPPKLTPMGREVADRAAELLAAEEQVLALCRGSDDLAGRFRLGFVATAAVRLLPDFLARAAVLVPRARFDVEVDVSEVLEGKVLGGQMDAAVVTASSPPSPALQYTMLRDEELVFAYPRGRQRDASKVSDASLPFLHFTPGIGIGILIAAYMEAHGDLLHQERLVLNSVEAIMQCVNRGIGYTLLPEPDVRHYADDRFVEIRRPATRLTRQLALATQPAGPIGHRMDLVADLFS